MFLNVWELYMQLLQVWVTKQHVTNHSINILATAQQHVYNNSAHQPHSTMLLEIILEQSINMSSLIVKINEF